MNGPPPKGFKIVTDDDYVWAEAERARQRRERGGRAETEAAPAMNGLTEDAAALAFTTRYRDTLRYCHDIGRWYRWTGTHWQPDRTGLAFHFARELIREMNRRREPRAKTVTGKAGFAAAVERFAQADRAHAVTSDAWDQDSWLLGTPGGTIDLRTGNLQPADPADGITKLTAVAPAAAPDCPTWLQFLDQATAGDDALIRFLRQWFGYCLTGSTREHALLFIYGPGGNGKTVLTLTMLHVLGDYAVTADMGTFAASQSDRHPTDLAMLRGARLVTASETDEGRAWAEARLKQVTGGDPITARFMRRDFFTYTPSFKLIAVGNHKPVLRNVDDAMRRRFNIVPFMHKPPVPDRDLDAKLRAEAPAILRWAIEGCLDWQRNGLVRPAVVTAATDEYLAAQDAFAAWAAECCKRVPHLATKPGTLLASFNEWAVGNAERQANRNQMAGWIDRQPDLRRKTVRGAALVEGIGLNAPDPRGKP